MNRNNDRKLIIKLKKKLKLHNESINDIKTFPSGNIISVSYDMSIKIYDNNLNIIQIINNAHNNGISQVMVDRLSLNKNKILSIADSIIDVMKLPNYIGEVIEEWTTETGLKIKKVRVPFGVIAAVFESRPNVV